MRALIHGVGALAVFDPTELNIGSATAQGLPLPEGRSVESDDKQDESDDATIPDIIVTAERRSSRLQDTPLAIYGLGQESHE